MNEEQQIQMESTPAAPGFTPARVLDVELSQPVEAITAQDPLTGRTYPRAILLVRLHGQPLSTIGIPLDAGDQPAVSVSDWIWDGLSGQINQHLREDGLPEIESLSPAGLPAYQEPLCLVQFRERMADAPLASIVVATRDRADSLQVALDSLLVQHYPHFDLIVVDNAPRTQATADLIRDRYAGRVKYVREDIPGLSVAHNAGLKDARGDIVAFTDDDVIADPQWLARMAAGFKSTDRVACVTGMIFPVEMETPAQAWVEEYGGFGKGFHQRVFDLEENRLDLPLYPYSAGRFGSGANMAFQTDFLRSIDGFDPATGTGTLAMGGDDLAAFFEVIARGFRLVYEPAAIIHHRHRRDYEGLRRQAYGYGVGLTAFLMKTLVDRPGRFFDLAARVPSGVAYVFNPHSFKNAGKKKDYPKELTALERQGMLYGPIAYLRSRWQARRYKSLEG